MDRIDCHCHIFNMVSVGWRVILEQLNDIVSPTDDRMPDRGIRDKFGKIAALIKAFATDSEHIFRQLDKEYQKKYKLFALMFDGDFLLNAAAKKQLREMNRKVRDSLSTRGFPAEGDGAGSSVSGKQKPPKDEDLLVVLDFLDEIDGESNTKELRALRKDGFLVQYEAIKEMAKHDSYKDRLIPFLGVDPRRPDIKSYLSEVGKGQLFAGIKVYPPNGFSPYDPVLVGDGSVFEYCHLHGIPVISHCSYGGFATPVRRIDVNGMIMREGSDQPVEVQQRYTFRTGLKDGFGVMVKERAAVLNHPKIWAKVLDKYENLILVLAHFGVGSDEWQDEIVRMMYQYKNLYTDVSCISEEGQLDRVKSIYQNHPEIRNKILYGSDFFLDLLFNDSFEQYLERMELTFGRQMFDQFSIDNPAEFMAKWYKREP